MGMNLEYSVSNAGIVEDLLHFGDIGDQKVIYGGYKNHTSFYGFIFTKCKSNLVKVYSIYKGYLTNSQFECPIAEISKSSRIHGGGKVKWSKGNYNVHHYRRALSNGSIDYTYRAFMSIGIIQNIGIRYLRISELWKFQDTEVGSIRSKDFSFGLNGKLISQVPKECKELSLIMLLKDIELKRTGMLELIMLIKVL